MSQKLSNWASIAEISSGIAVVVTLLLLFLGIRDSNQITRASMYSNVIDGVNELDRDIYRDPELSELWGRFLSRRNLSDLTSPERRRLALIVLVQFRNYDKAFIAFQNGIIGNAEWQRFEGPMCDFLDGARDVGVTIVESNSLRASFREMIAMTCEEVAE
jgi:hypothetical protein